MSTRGFSHLEESGTGAGAGFLSLETEVKILDGPDAPDLNLKLFTLMQGEAAAAGKFSWFGRELSRDEFREMMVTDQRLIYEFEIKRAYGFY